MKNKNQFIEFISFYNNADLEKHFTKMAKKGWLVERKFGLGWIYRSIEPADLHFSMTCYPEASEFDPGPSEAQQTFYELCAHTGWQLACISQQTHIFYNKQENPIPIETDPIIEVETRHRTSKKGFLPAMLIILAYALYNSISSAIWIFTDPIGLLAESSEIMLSICLLAQVIFCAAELIVYYAWLFKARKAAQGGVFIDMPGTTILNACFFIFAMIAVGFVLFDMLFAGSQIRTFITLLMIIVVSVVIFLVITLKKGLKKLKVSKGVNMAVTLYTCCVLTTIMVVLVFLLTIGTVEAGYLDTDYDDPPLYVSDLMEVDDDDYRDDDEFNQSILLAEHIVELDGKSGAPDLQYKIVTVKASFLYDWCKKQLYNENYVQQDATHWEAEEIYRLYSKKGWTNTYLLCYEDRLVEIQFDWEPTAEQMTIADKKLAP